MDTSLGALAHEHADALIGLLGATFGTVLTGISVWLTTRAATARTKVQHAHEERVQGQKLARERLEELFVLVGNWLNGFTENFGRLTLVMKGHTDYNQYLDSLIASDVSYDFNRLEMIVRIYGETVGTSYQEVLEVRERVNDLIAEHKAAYLRGEDGRKFLNPFTTLHLQLIERGESFRNRIAQAARDA